MTDERSADRPQMAVQRAAPPRLERPGDTGKKGRSRARGVAAGRIAAAGMGIAAMLGLTASMQVAGSHAKSVSGASAPPPAPGLAALRWEASTHRGAALRPDGTATAAARKPIVLTPHTVVHTVGGGSSGGSGGSYAGSYSAPAAAAAPVATTSGSRAP